jgi:hypothetical protein
MIIVAGDSWGVGSWSRSQHNQGARFLTGLNFATLASLHNDLGAVNLCSGGTTLQEALGRYERFLDRYTPDHSDTFYWILTNPLRNINLDDIKTCITIDQAANDILSDNLQKANLLAYKHKIKINLIGGLCDLDPNLVNGLDHLVCAVPSWCQLIDKECVKSILGPDTNWEKIGEYIKKHRLDLLDEWLSFSDVMLIKNKFYKKHPTYFKYGDSHPSTEANKLLKDYLYPEFTNIF